MSENLREPASPDLKAASSRVTLDQRTPLSSVGLICLCGKAWSSMEGVARKCRCGRTWIVTAMLLGGDDD